MAATDRIKQALMGIGLLTVLAVGAFAALMAYIWWDSRSAADEEYATETDFDADASTEEAEPADEAPSGSDGESPADADDTEVTAD